MEENVLYVKTLKKRDIVANMDKNKLFVECDCYTHAIVVDRTDEDGHGDYEYCLAFFERGYDGQGMSFKERLRWCWQILRRGHPWTDSIILDRNKAKRLGEFLSQ